MENIVTVKELAGFLKLTEATVYKLASSRELPGFKIGRSWRFDMEEVLKRIQELTMQQEMGKNQTRLKAE